MLQGDLSEITIGEVIQALSLNRREGTLRIRTPQGEKLFFLSKGEIQLIQPGKRTDVLAEALVRAEKIDERTLQVALDGPQEGARGTTKVRKLVGLGLLDERDLDEVLQRRFRDEFFELFLIDEGSFEFLFGVRPERLVRFDEEMSRLSLNTSELMMDALRHIDEWAVTSKAIPTPRAIFRIIDPSSPALEALSPTDSRVTYLLDGHRTLAEVIAESGCAKFDVYALLFGLLRKGCVRTLTHAECVVGAAASEDTGDLKRAAAFSAYGLFLSPDDLPLRERHFKLMKQLGHREDARDAALAVGDRRLDAGEGEAALAYFLEAQALDDKDVRVAQRVLRALRKLSRPPREIKGAASQYLRLATRSHDVERLKEALGTLIELEPQEPGWHLQLGDVLSNEGLRGEAIGHYERLIERTRESRDPKDAALLQKVCRRILAIDDAREDVRARLEGSIRAEKRAQTARRRRVIAAMVLPAMLLVVAWCGNYELHARSYLDDAAAELRVGRPFELREAEERLRWILREYPYSSVAREAAGMLADVRSAIARASAQAEARRGTAVAPDDKMRMEAADLLRHALAMERIGNYKEAATARLEVVRRYPDEQVTLPVPIDSRPGGARVTWNGTVIGTTPLVHGAEPRKPARVVVELAGFTSSETLLTGERYEEVRAELQRATLWTVKADVAPGTGPVLAFGKIFVVERDGKVSALDKATGASLWASRVWDAASAASTSLTSPAAAAGKVWVGAGLELVALDASSGRKVLGTVLPGQVVGVPHRSSLDQLVAVPSTAGVVLVRGADGERAYRIPAAQPPGGALAFGGGISFVASGDALLASSESSGASRWVYRAGARILAAPCITGQTVILGTEDGRVHAVGASDGSSLWTYSTGASVSVEPVACGRTVFVGCADGQVHALEVGTGARVFVFAAGAPVRVPPAAGKALYVETDDGMLSAVDLASGALLWRYAVKATPSGSPVVAGGVIYVAATDGSLRALAE